MRILSAALMGGIFLASSATASSVFSPTSELTFQRVDVSGSSNTSYDPITGELKAFVDPTRTFPSQPGVFSGSASIWVDWYFENTGDTDIVLEAGAIQYSADVMISSLMGTDSSGNPVDLIDTSDWSARSEINWEPFTSGLFGGGASATLENDPTYRPNDPYFQSTRVRRGEIQVDSLSKEGFDYTASSDAFTLRPGDDLRIDANWIINVSTSVASGVIIDATNTATLGLTLGSDVVLVSNVPNAPAGSLQFIQGGATPPPPAVPLPAAAWFLLSGLGLGVVLKKARRSA